MHGGAGGDSMASEQRTALQDARQCTGAALKVEAYVQIQNVGKRVVCHTTPSCLLARNPPSSQMKVDSGYLFGTLVPYSRYAPGQAQVKHTVQWHINNRNGQSSSA